MSFFVSSRLWGGVRQTLGLPGAFEREDQRSSRSEPFEHGSGSSFGFRRGWLLAALYFGLFAGLGAQANDLALPTDGSAQPRGDASSQAGSLYLFMNPSARRIHWSSPRALLVSTLRSTVASKAGSSTGARETALGHLVVHYQCRDLEGREHTGWVGMTGQNDSKVDRQDLLQDQIGMGVLLKLYSDGELISDEVSKAQVALNSGRMEFDGLIPRQMDPKFLSVALTAQQCSHLVRYVAEYRERSYDSSVPLSEWEKRGVDRMLFYGFPIRDPWKSFQRFEAGEREVPLGGGCTAYGVSFLKLAQAHSPELERFFTRRLLISERLIGAPSSDSSAATKVSVQDLLFGSLGSRWQHASYRDRSLEIYDPQYMWDFIDGVQSCAKAKRLPGTRGLKVFRKTCTDELSRWVDANRSRIAPAEQLALELEIEEERDGLMRRRMARMVRSGIFLGSEPEAVELSGVH